MTLPELRASHLDAERALVVSALEASSWRLTPAARELAVMPVSLRRTIIKLGLADEYGARNPGAGRPRRRGSGRGRSSGSHTRRLFFLGPTAPRTVLLALLLEPGVGGDYPAQSRLGHAEDS